MTELSSKLNNTIPNRLNNNSPDLKKKSSKNIPLSSIKNSNKKKEMKNIFEDTEYLD